MSKNVKEMTRDEQYAHFLNSKAFHNQYKSIIKNTHENLLIVGREDKEEILKYAKFELNCHNNIVEKFEVTNDKVIVYAIEEIVLRFDLVAIEITHENWFRMFKWQMEIDQKEVQ